MNLKNLTMLGLLIQQAINGESTGREDLRKLEQAMGAVSADIAHEQAAPSAAPSYMPTTAPSNTAQPAPYLFSQAQDSAVRTKHTGSPTTPAPTHHPAKQKKATRSPTAPTSAPTEAYTVDLISNLRLLHFPVDESNFSPTAGGELRANEPYGWGPAGKLGDPPGDPYITGPDDNPVISANLFQTEEFGGGLLLTAEDLFRAMRGYPTYKMTAKQYAEFEPFKEYSAIVSNAVLIASIATPIPDGTPGGPVYSDAYYNMLAKLKGSPALAEVVSSIVSKDKTPTLYQIIKEGKVRGDLNKITPAQIQGFLNELDANVKAAINANKRALTEDNSAVHLPSAKELMEKAGHEDADRRKKTSPPTMNPLYAGWGEGIEYTPKICDFLTQGYWIDDYTKALSAQATKNYLSNPQNPKTTSDGYPISILVMYEQDPKGKAPGTDLVYETLIGWPIKWTPEESKKGRNLRGG